VREYKQFISHPHVRLRLQSPLVHWEGCAQILGIKQRPIEFTEVVIKITITVTEVKYFTPLIARLKIISVQFKVIDLVQI
jgi:hypothetical protein